MRDTECLCSHGHILSEVRRDLYFLKLFVERLCTSLAELSSGIKGSSFRDELSSIEFSVRDIDLHSGNISECVDVIYDMVCGLCSSLAACGTESDSG